MAGSASPPTLEAALDELYGVEPSSFVEVRKRLAGALRSAGDPAGAKSLLAARRPTTAAWALNQLSREHPELVETFLAASHDLERAQTGELPGGRDAARDATRAQRDALDAVSDAALAALGERGTDAYRGPIQATLRASGADPAVGDQLRHGRFERELTGATGFPDFPGLTLVPDLEPSATTAAEAERGARPRKAPPKQRSKPERERGADRAAERAEQAARARAAREREAAEERDRLLAEAEDAARRAGDERAAAEAAAAAVHHRIDVLKQDLDRARHEARAADDRASRADREATRLDRAAAKLRPR
ncbi:MAG TPA: hypothetical protein VGN59_15220 [Acidimicrobiia bacterium]|jgi:hypothetical protein